jgi:hypothetical protein
MTTPDASNSEYKENSTLLNFFGHTDEHYYDISKLGKSSLLSSSNYLQKKKNYTLYRNISEDINNNYNNSNIQKSKSGKYIFPSISNKNIFRKAKSDYLLKCLVKLDYGTTDATQILQQSTSDNYTESDNVIYCPNKSQENQKLSGLQNFNGTVQYDKITYKPDISYNITTTTTINKSLNISNNNDGDLIFTTTDTPTTTINKNISYIDDTTNPIFSLDCNKLPHFYNYYKQPNPLYEPPTNNLDGGELGGGELGDGELQL